MTYPPDLIEAKAKADAAWQAVSTCAPGTSPEAQITIDIAKRRFEEAHVTYIRLLDTYFQQAIHGIPFGIQP